MRNARHQEPLQGRFGDILKRVRQNVLCDDVILTQKKDRSDSDMGWRDGEEPSKEGWAGPIRAPDKAMHPEPGSSAPASLQMMTHADQGSGESQNLER